MSSRGFRERVSTSESNNLGNFYSCALGLTFSYQMKDAKANHFQDRQYGVVGKEPRFWNQTRI